MAERKKKRCMKIKPVFLTCLRIVVRQSLDQCDSIKYFKLSLPRELKITWTIESSQKRFN